MVGEISLEDVHLWLMLWLVSGHLWLIVAITEKPSDQLYGFGTSPTQQLRS